MTVLVIAAHPDDEVLGCGGTIARLVGEGHSVYVAILGEGITSRYTQREEASSQDILTLEACSHRVARFLGIKELFGYQLPDNRFDTVPLLDIAKILENLIGKIQPHVIYTHHIGDLNIDHAVTCRAVLTAARPLPSSLVKEILSFEVPSSTEWAFNQLMPAFCPNVFVDITATLSQKFAAMEIYESETRPFPHPRSTKALQALASLRGSAVGLEAAEAFQQIRSIR